MTPGRVLTLAICVPVSLAMIGWTAFSAVAAVGTGKYTFSTPLNVSGGKLTADLPNADVTLTPGSSARLAGTVTYSLVRPDLTVSDSGVSYRCEIPTGHCGVNATLTVPSAADSVVLASSGGDLSVNAGITSNVTLTSSGGDIVASRLNGTADLISGGGDITATGLTGTADLDSGGGDIIASGVTDPDVTARSSGGDITLTFTKIPRDVQVSSGGGDIEIVVPSGSYQVNATGDGGNVSSFPDDSAARDVITADSGGGDITITES
jgi:hypothetical protein